MVVGEGHRLVVGRALPCGVSGTRQKEQSEKDGSARHRTSGDACVRQSIGLLREELRHDVMADSMCAMLGQSSALNVFDS